NLEPNGGGIYIWNGSKWYYIGGGKGIATVPDHFEPSCATNSVCQKFFDEGFYPVPLSDTDRTFNVTYQSRSADFVMKPVTGGVFYMGNQTTDNSKPNYDTGSTAYSVHQVGVSSFYMSKTEVTQKQFLTVMDAAGEDNTLPITYRSWYDAIAFCNKLSLLDGKEPCYSVSTVSNWATLAYSSIPTSNTDAWNNVIWDKTANGYRLATEAEWEYAARGGQKNEYTRTLGASGTQYVFSGSNTINDVAWNVNLGGATREVATKAANDLGLHDMSGNVWEFCWDRHGDYSTCCEESPVGATSGERILRGGSYSGTLHVSARHSYSGSSYNRIYPDHGFRIVCSAF
ncbi:MAG: formylglycine-generating enzyme family protein, partial [Prevotellaceae bacterium]|nr:formylglycine-generating enzyme family protein [Prevotellaceae bacterium]